jgi:hypothetical protein
MGQRGRLTRDNGPGRDGGLLPSRPGPHPLSPPPTVVVAIWDSFCGFHGSESRGNPGLDPLTESRRLKELHCLR